ncbi:MAG: hypothetical protein QOE78_4595 [Alphaproteobacteria bacterium]|nr:hypothetical protein [Alphaproteobacteria bacterium]
MQGVGDAVQPLPGDDRAGFHPWLTLTAVAAAATRSQPGGAHKARRDGPEQVRSILVAARPPLRTHWTKGATRPQVLARARPARGRIGPDRRDHGQAVCCPNSPPSPHFNAHADHSHHHRIPSGNRPARPPQEGNTRVCRSAIASHRNRPTEPPTLPANMAKGRNRRRCTFSDRSCVNVRSQQLNRSKCGCGKAAPYSTPCAAPARASSRRGEIPATHSFRRTRTNWKEPRRCHAVSSGAARGPSPSRPKGCPD